MLNQLPQIYAPHPPHILMIFYPLLPGYGDLNNFKNFETLANDVCTYIEINPVPWPDLDLDRKAIIQMCRRRTLLELFIKINEWQCLRNEKSIWCCKSLETIYYIEHFHTEDFHPFVIYLVRDGRDVAVSFKKIMIGEKHIYHLATKWRDEQELALRYLTTIAHAHERFIIIKYEDLIMDPDGYLMEICQKLKIPYNAGVSNYYSSQESQLTAEAGRMWENVAKPVIKDNKNKYLQALSAEELQIFETIAGDTLEKLGYQRTNGLAEIQFIPEIIQQYGEENERLKKQALREASEHDILKRRPQRDFINQLKRKLAIV